MRKSPQSSVARRMEDFGQRMSEASNKEEMLTYRQKLSDLKQEMLNLQEAFLQEKAPFVAGMVRPEWLHISECLTSIAC